MLLLIMYLHVLCRYCSREVSLYCYNLDMNIRTKVEMFIPVICILGYAFKKHLHSKIWLKSNKRPELPLKSPTMIKVNNFVIMRVRVMNHMHSNSPKGPLSVYEILLHYF